MNFKRLKKIFVFIVAISAVAIVVMIPISIKNRNKMLSIYEIEYWNQTDVDFCGIVNKKKMIDHGFGFVCLTKTYSNKKDNFELYINDEVFVCQIKSDKIIFITNLVDLNMGDSLCYNIDGNRKEIRFRNGEKIIEYENRIITPTRADYSPKRFSCF